MTDDTKFASVSLGFNGRWETASFKVTSLPLHSHAPLRCRITFDLIGRQKDSPIYIDLTTEHGEMLMKDLFNHLFLNERVLRTMVETLLEELDYFLRGGNEDEQEPRSETRAGNERESRTSRS
jgi:hypothetical protein